MFGTKSPREKIFHRALSREAGRLKRVPSRGKEMQTKIPYGVLSLWSIFFVTVGHIFFLSPLLTITEVSIIGADRVPQPRLFDTVETVLQEKYGRVFAKNNFLFFPRKEVQEVLLQQYPLLSTVDIARKFPDQITIRVTEKPYLLLWCSNGPCYQLDSKNYPYSSERLLYALYEPWRLMVIDTSALPVTSEAPFDTAQEYLHSFASYYSLFPKVISLSLKSQAFTPSKFSRELRVATEAGFDVLLSLDIPPEDTLSALKAFLDRRNKDVVGTKNPLALVDLRVPGRIFFSEVRSDDTESLIQETVEVPEEKDQKEGHQGQKKRN